MRQRIEDAVERLKRKTKEVQPEVLKETLRARLILTHEERLSLARLMRSAHQSGTTVTELCRWYGTTNRRTVMDILEYEGVIPDPIAHEVGGKPIHEYFTAKRIDEYRVEVSSVEPLPVTAWQVAEASEPWEGSVTTDGVLVDNPNPLWVELKSTDLPEKLGIGDVFNEV